MARPGIQGRHEGAWAGPSVCVCVWERTGHRGQYPTARLVSAGTNEALSGANWPLYGA